MTALIDSTLGSKKSREENFPAALEKLVAAAGDHGTLSQTLTMLRELNSRGGFDEVPFESVWNILQALAKSTE